MDRNHFWAIKQADGNLKLDPEGGLFNFGDRETCKYFCMNNEEPVMIRVIPLFTDKEIEDIEKAIQEYIRG